MAKTCSTCHAENRDDAQFCRACGTSFAATPAPRNGNSRTRTTCAECGFENKPGVRYCAKCGAGLTGSARAAPASASPAGTVTPPPGYPPADIPLPVPDVPDPATAVAVERAYPTPMAASGIGFGAPPSVPAPKRTGLWAGLVSPRSSQRWIAGWFLNTAPAPPESARQPPPRQRRSPAAASARAPPVTAEATTRRTPIVGRHDAARPSCTGRGDQRSAPPAAAAPASQTATEQAPRRAAMRASSNGSRPERKARDRRSAKQR
jgi:hypothetical protein